MMLHKAAASFDLVVQYGCQSNHERGERARWSFFCGFFWEVFAKSRKRMESWKRASLESTTLSEAGWYPLTLVSYHLLFAFPKRSIRKESSDPDLFTHQLHSNLLVALLIEDDAASLHTERLSLIGYFRIRPRKIHILISRTRRCSHQQTWNNDPKLHYPPHP